MSLPHRALHNDTQKKTLHLAQISIIELIKLIEQNGLAVQTVRPAIFGKLLKFKSIRKISSLMQKIFFIIPLNILPLRAMSYFSESFLIYAKKK
jgi:hypothetical protein